MRIVYNDTKKDLPVEQLHRLFFEAGWTDSEFNLDDDMMRNFNLPFINSTLIISAWENDTLIGVVRVLSDKIMRSAIYDLVVLPEYQSKGIGKELVKRCIEHFPNCEWLVQTEAHITGYYEKMGFKVYGDVVLTISSKYQRSR